MSVPSELDGIEAGQIWERNLDGTRIEVLATHKHADDVSYRNLSDRRLAAIYAFNLRAHYTLIEGATK